MKPILRISSALIGILAVIMVLRQLFGSEKRTITVKVMGEEKSVTIVPGELRRNDQVAFYWLPPDEGTGLARVVAFPGERVKITTGAVYVGGEAYRQAKFPVGRGVNMAEIVIPNGRLFLMGETRGPDSLKYGPVPKMRVAGKGIEGD